MNEHFDPLEAELAALAPHSPSPELRDRIAQELTATVLDRRTRDTHTATRRTLIFAALATSLAACVVLVLLLQRGNRVALQAPSEEIPRPSLAAAFDESLPTVWSYRRAVFASPDQIDELLDKHAGGEGRFPDDRLPVSAFPMTSTDLDSLLGDL